MRKLASIQEIKKIEKIEGADNIELAFVLGWQVVVNKGKYKEGDLAVFFEVDSFLPVCEEFEFLRKTCYKNTHYLGEGFKLRTVKLRGVLSQGLLERIDTFKQLDKTLNVGDDVTDILNVKQWQIEEVATTSGNICGVLPASIPHTDEIRIQTEPKLLEEFANKNYYISTKMDGSSHSIGIDSNGFHVCGHNYEYKDDGHCSFYEWVNDRKLREKITNYYRENHLDSFVIQGEFCAPGIQKNRLKLIKPQWYVFTIIINNKRVSLESMINICKYLNIENVPIEEIGYNLPAKYPDIESLLQRADGEYPNGGKKEGIVIRTTTPEFCKIISAPLSMKVINNNYLLKNED